MRRRLSTLLLVLAVMVGALFVQFFGSVDVVKAEMGEVISDQDHAWIEGDWLYWMPPEGVDYYVISYVTGPAKGLEGSWNTCAVYDFAKDNNLRKNSSCGISVHEMDFVANETDSIIIESDRPKTWQIRGYNERKELIMQYYGDVYVPPDFEIVPYDELPNIGRLRYKEGGFLEWDDLIEKKYISNYRVSYYTGRRSELHRPGLWASRAYVNVIETEQGSAYKVPFRGRTYNISYKTTDGRISAWSESFYVPEEGEEFDEFLDIFSSRYRLAINDLAKRGIIEGVEEGYYLPKELVSRAEFIKVLVLANYGEEYNARIADFEDGCFPDVASGEWYTGPICFAKEKGIITGYSDGKMQPFRNVSAAEATKILLHGFDLVPESSEVFAENWYTPYISESRKKDLNIETFGGKLEYEISNYALIEINREEMAGLVNLYL